MDCHHCYHPLCYQCSSVPVFLPELGRLRAIYNRLWLFFWVKKHLVRAWTLSDFDVHAGGHLLCAWALTVNSGKLLGGCLHGGGHLLGTLQHPHFLPMATSCHPKLWLGFDPPYLIIISLLLEMGKEPLTLQRTKLVSSAPAVVEDFVKMHYLSWCTVLLRVISLACVWVFFLMQMCSLAGSLM